MTAPAGQSLPLILAREFASNLATPLAVLDAAGSARLLQRAGRAHHRLDARRAGRAERGGMARALQREHPDGSPAGLEEMATAIARREKRPAQKTQKPPKSMVGGGVRAAAAIPPHAGPELDRAAGRHRPSGRRHRDRARAGAPRRCWCAETCTGDRRTLRELYDKNSRACVRPSGELRCEECDR